MFLYYLLALRLRNKQPTFFQFVEDVVILFDNHGVTTATPRSREHLGPYGSWALIDSNTDVKSVPRISTGGRGRYLWMHSKDAKMIRSASSFQELLGP